MSTTPSVTRAPGGHNTASRVAEIAETNVDVARSDTNGLARNTSNIGDQSVPSGNNATTSPVDTPQTASAGLCFIDEVDDAEMKLDDARARLNDPSQRLIHAKSKSKLQIDDVVKLYKISTRRLDMDLSGADSEALDGRAFRISVVMWEDGVSHAMRRQVLVSKPRLPWFYDLDLKANIAFVARASPAFIISAAEINWIAVNQCDFDQVFYWDYFDSIGSSLREWQRYLTLCVNTGFNPKYWTSKQISAVKVRPTSKLFLKRVGFHLNKHKMFSFLRNKLEAIVLFV